MSLANLFKKARGNTKLVTAAAELDCSPGYLGTIEAGKNTPSPGFCETAAIVLDCPEIAYERWASEVKLLEDSLKYAQRALREWNDRVTR